MIKHVALLLACCLCTSYACAGVRALTDETSGSIDHLYNRTLQNSDYETNNYRDCEDLGFTLTECPSKYVPINRCPTDNSYFKYCCPEEYQFSEKECINMGLMPSEESCHGYFSCI